MAENVPVFAAPPQPARNPVKQDLAWIGFGTEGNRNIIWDDVGLEAFKDLIGLAESDIRDIASGLSYSNTTQGSITFGMWRVKYTLGVMHWAQDGNRWYRTVSLTGVSNAEEYKALLGKLWIDPH